MASAVCQVKSGVGAYASTTNGFTTAPGSTTTIKLASAAGVGAWSIACTSTDEMHSTASVNAGLAIDALAKTCTFTAPGAGAALLFTSTVTSDNGITSVATFGIYTLTSGGLRVGAVGETIEGNAAFGTTALLNAKIREGSGGGGGGSSSAGAVSEVQVSDGVGGFSAPGGVRAGSEFMTFGSGSLIPTTGTHRFAIGKAFATVRNISNTDDKTLWKHEIVYGFPASKEHLYLGSDPSYVSAQSADVLHVNANDSVEQRVAGSKVVTLNTAVRVTQPIVGDLSPYGAHGESEVYMNDVDVDLSMGAEGHVLTILPGGAGAGSGAFQTAIRKLSLPNVASSERGYTKFIRNTNGSGFSIVVAMASMAAGTTTTVNIVDGLSCMVGVHAGGVYRMTPDVAV